MKKCKIYYAIIDNSIKNKSKTKAIEPVKTYRRDALGEKPDFCCEELKKAVYDSIISLSYDKVTIDKVQNSSLYTYAEIHFCPFCGAVFEFIHHLNLVVKEAKCETLEYYYEAVYNMDIENVHKT